MTDVEMWWDPRRNGEATATYLARVLDTLGATELAQDARRFYFDDYRCPPDVDDGANIMRLVHSVYWWGRQNTPDGSEQRRRAMAVVRAAKDGEFDGTKEESDAWAASPEGRATFAELLRGKRT